MPRPAPTSTYRLQLTPDFTFADAERILPYLRGIGIDWVYCSPITQAGEGSTHGYDVVDPTRIDEARGGREAFESMARAAHELGLGVLVDVVPNHQGVGDAMANPMWRDLLAHGQESRHADTFDVDWEAGCGKVLLPVLGDGDMPREPGAPIGGLALGEREVDGETVKVLEYHDRAFPLAPGTADDGADAATVHERQRYRLIHWRQGDTEINYRRFFTITSLAGVRVEDERVFEETHAEILRWVREGLVDGLRIDHIDGLRDPEGYLRRLEERTGGCYLVVEKILEMGAHGLAEELPESWPVAGTTGYEAIAAIDRVLVDPDGDAELAELSQGFAGLDRADDERESWGDLCHDMKREVADRQLLAEVYRITRELIRTGVDHPQIVDCVAEVISNLDVYRSYLPVGVERLDAAAHRAWQRRPDLAEALSVVMPALRDPSHPAALRFQQSSGMVMAKGVEDRAFFRDSRLTSLNEVGGDPSRFAISPDEFHERLRRRHERSPFGLNALTTHDTKRSEDVRARIDVLSECPERWRETIETLERVAPAGDANLASLIWQGVVGAWPARRERLEGFAEKAAREAGLRTSWTAQNAEAEATIRAAVGAAFDHPAAASVVSNLADELREDGWSNALSAKLIQLTMPGVPDVYQGTELWAFTLTDPDNRMPVSYASRQAALDAILKGAKPELDETGAAKLLVTAAALLTRRERPHLFTGYEPVRASGSAAEHVLAFDRGGAMTIATRLPRGLREGGGWGDTQIELPAGVWVDQLTARAYQGGRSASVAALLDEYPVALLARG
ncbi:Maltooligosyl trehalose synthase [Pseudoclavibacter triregionum]|nr:Maltooligosyl trehalose synthase [Pseudoclavibacter triregionum]